MASDNVSTTKDGAAECRHAARLAASGQRDEAAAVLRAWRDFRALAPGLPRPARGERLVLPTYRGSVVADYFARGRRRFSDLSDGWQ